MNFRIYKYTIALTALVVLSCTKKFDSINTNPDKSTTARADWLATAIISSSTYGDISSQKGFMQPLMLAKYILWTELQESYQYNSIGQTGAWERYNVLRNIDPMLQYAASDPETYPSYRGLAHFIRAWQFYQLTMQVGDIPYSEAVQGKSEKNLKPKYDNQKDVFKGILNELDSANLLFSTGKDFSGDFIYKGSVDQWRRLTNTFALYVLINLHKKTADADLNVVDRFKDIVTNRPLMRDYKDNFAVTYINSANYCYPWSSTPVQKNQFTIYPMISTTLIDLLKTHNDRRLFYYAEPAASAIKAGLTANNFNAYIGVEPSDPYSSTTSAHSAGTFSDVNKRYVDLYNAEPVSLLNYWDLQFILAEATVRGWISGTPAQNYYTAGIQSSMNFLVNFTPATYNHGMEMDAIYINSYPATVALTGNQDNQLRQIITQKYIAGFLHGADYNAWYEFRRTGYPQFKLNTNTNLNTPNTQFPVRWKYPQVELNNNGDNYKAAIQSQYGGNDDVNQVMWLLK
ncbi:SusD/RagB family nutrient-binding outer membrane lipoprotein [Niabella beijingensis]|uniref:SusD/RagB family nutrient-binding outer membrane lipoprotein n=1 Tax=Niabella beijingensis TaxID=2872700 RepID=UPI001CBF4B38|nr:SusD/RagB family nutrient-binding outer membrane lipoprotein [Niabella beijingensis]MBZ4189070.1 SusD/RagB family nutrient-binding outer membrane lipoprotein [Niabella beijingensis]